MNDDIPVVKLVRETPLKPEPMILNPWEVWCPGSHNTYDRVASYPSEDGAMAHLNGRTGFVVNVEDAVRAAMPARKTVKIHPKCSSCRHYMTSSGYLWHDKLNACGDTIIAILDLGGIEVEVPE